MAAPMAASGPLPPVVITVAAGAPVHTLNPLHLGCHSDSGFTHQVRGFSSQMLFGESFESPQPNATFGVAADAWSFSAGEGCNGTTRLLNATVGGQAMHGAFSRRLTITSASAQVFATLSNRGLGNEGLFFEANRSYEGFFFARCASPVQLVVRLERTSARGPPSAIGERQIRFACGPSPQAWVRVEFNMTTTAGANCEGIDVGSDPEVHCTRPTTEAGHSCVRCAGQFSLSLASVGSVDVDYVVLQPGAWGRLKDPVSGELLPVRKQTADTLLQMGITALRVGGSFASVTEWPDGGGGTPPSTRSGSYYQWQKWAGPAWLRPSVGAVWNGYGGTSYSLIGGWGPFEVIDMCNALGIEPIVTTTSSSAPTELADLVEYCHGSATDTEMGRRRAADGHPHPYRVHLFELGNEQYNTRFVQQVQAMEARAKAVGLEGTLKYLFPSNGGLSSADVDAAKKLGIDAQIAPDIHVGAGGALQEVARLFSAREDFQQSAVNLETNAGTHTHRRALQEAADLNAFFNANQSVQDRVLVRCASFCTERSGHFDQFDQGISFFLPNMSWLQPPGHVHAMIASSRQPHALKVQLSASRAAVGPLAEEHPTRSLDSILSVSAQSSSNGDAIVVRIVNPLTAPIGPNGTATWSAKVLLGSEVACATCSLTTLSAPDATMANPSWAPDLVSPSSKRSCSLSGGRMARLPLVPLSYSVVQLSGCAATTRR